MDPSPIILRPVFDPARRILVVSDIHGNLPFFRGLMEKVSLTPDDILVLDGDMLEKGAHSLALLRHLMALCETHTLVPICGNCDGLVLNFFETDRLDEVFYQKYLPQHPESTLRQLAREGGFDQTEDLPRLREDLRNTFPAEWAWLKSLPTIVETEHLLFVHGGVPSLENMEQLSRWKCMKNDDFRSQGHRFSKYVIVGHWPVTLYDPRIPNAAPIVDRDARIVSIDGGCVLKADGQLNALIIPGEGSDDFSWAAYDGLPTAVALDPQQAGTDSVNIRWGRSELELLEPGEELSLCRHLETGRVMPILNHYLQPKPEGLFCEDSTDYALPVAPGDELSVVCSTKQGHLCKKDGATGWYYGRLAGHTIENITKDTAIC